MKHTRYLLSIIAFFLVLGSCNNRQENKDLAIKTLDDAPSEHQATPLTKNFKDYWYAGEAEISSYELKQARYGEIRDGKAVLIFVTEPFLPKEQVKADNPNAKNISVLKLNSTKNFYTGIYPYSIMSSTFYPVDNNQQAIKVSASIQEWCGQQYVQLNNRDGFKVTSHSYFQGDADMAFTLGKATLENEIWTQLRIDPQSVETGKKPIIPALEYAKLKHVELKAYEAEISQEQQSGTIVTIISYPTLNRRLTITQNSKFPFEITSWEETSVDGLTELTTTATRLKTIKSPYWQKNANKDQVLRDSLQL